MVPSHALAAHAGRLHRSIARCGSTCPTACQPAVGHGVYHRYLDQLEFAEQVGFDGIGVNEHHANAYGLMPSPNIMAATLTRRTSKAALVVLGNSIALYNPPLRVAEEFAMLDVLSGGRLVAGFPVGTSMDTNYAYGTIPALTREKYAEAHELIRKAWAADEPFAFNGRYTKLRYVNCWPKPIQRPAPPIFIPGGGSVETYDFCDSTYVLYLSYLGYMRAKLLMDGYWKRVAERGVDEIAVSRRLRPGDLHVADTDARPRSSTGRTSAQLRRCLRLLRLRRRAGLHRTVKTIQTGALSQFTRAAARSYPGANLEGPDREPLRHRRLARDGAPAVEEMIKTLRVGNVFCLLHLGDMPDDKVRHSTRLFAEKVIPKLRNLWPEWNDRRPASGCIRWATARVPLKVAAE
ncbi:MAG: LLM class flavin-dependent oxidoreductase [Reyranellaceae bacterium]